MRTPEQTNLLKTNWLLVFVGAVASLLLTSCGGGGGESTPLPPPTTATVSVPPSGGSVSIDSRVVATVAPSTLLAQGDVTVTLSLKADAEALSSNDIALSLPADKLIVSPTGEITVYFYPDDTTAAAASTRKGALALPRALDPSTLFAKVKVGSEKAVAFTASVAWDAAKGVYVVSLKTTQLASAALQWTGRKIEQNVVDPLVPVYLASLDLQFSIWRALTLDDSSTTRVLYKWSASEAVSAASTPENVPTGKVPLILVHGIEATPFYQCGTNSLYHVTWQKFADKFFNPPFVELPDEKLSDKYQLYTFQYPTNQPIKRNSRWLAQRIFEHFPNRPVVIVGHSMGGLVTRAAELHYSKQGINGVNALWDIDIRGVITLDTPHLGVNWVDNVAILDEKLCFGPDTHQGALDLRWERNDDGTTCDNPLLCDPVVGLNTYTTEVNNTKHLKKYIPYAGNFDIAGAPLPGVLASSPLSDLVATATALYAAP